MLKFARQRLKLSWQHRAAKGANSRMSSAGRTHMGEKRSRGEDEYDFSPPRNLGKPIDLVELQLWAPRQGHRRQNISVWTDLRFAEQSLRTEFWRIEIKLAKAELAATFHGCSVEQGTRLGDDAKKIFEMAIEHGHDETSLVGSGEAKAKLGAGLTTGVSASASLQGSGKAERRSKTATKRKTEIQNYRIKALPNYRWQIVELRSQFLDGTYLRAPSKDETEVEPLCELQILKNQFSISLEVRASPQDLILNIVPLGTRSWLTGTPEKPNKEAVAKLLVQAAMMTKANRLGDERVTLAKSILEGRRKAAPEDTNGAL
jgi:hypothetical protein